MLCVNDCLTIVFSVSRRCVPCPQTVVTHMFEAHVKPIPSMAMLLLFAIHRRVQIHPMRVPADVQAASDSLPVVEAIDTLLSLPADSALPLSHGFLVTALRHALRVATRPITNQNKPHHQRVQKLIDKVHGLYLLGRRLEVSEAAVWSAWLTRDRTRFVLAPPRRVDAPEPGSLTLLRNIFAYIDRRIFLDDGTAEHARVRWLVLHAVTSMFLVTTTQVLVKQHIDAVQLGASQAELVLNAVWQPVARALNLFGHYNLRPSVNTLTLVVEALLHLPESPAKLHCLQHMLHWVTARLCVLPVGVWLPLLASARAGLFPVPVLEATPLSSVIVHGFEAALPLPAASASAAVPKVAMIFGTLPHGTAEPLSPRFAAVAQILATMVSVGLRPDDACMGLWLDTASSLPEVPLSFFFFSFFMRVSSMSWQLQVARVHFC
jgi:hypothetical protein